MLAETLCRLTLLLYFSDFSPDGPGDLECSKPYANLIISAIRVISPQFTPIFKTRRDFNAVYPARGRRADY